MLYLPVYCFALGFFTWLQDCIGSRKFGSGQHIEGMVILFSGFLSFVLILTSDLIGSPIDNDPSTVRLETLYFFSIVYADPCLCMCCVLLELQVDVGCGCWVGLRFATDLLDSNFLLILVGCMCLCSFRAAGGHWLWMLSGVEVCLWTYWIVIFCWSWLAACVFVLLELQVDFGCRSWEG